MPTFFIYAPIIPRSFNIHKALSTRHYPQGIIHTALSTRHYPQGIIHKTLSTRHYPQCIIHKALSTRHYPQGITHKALSTRHYPQGIIHKETVVEQANCQYLEYCVNNIVWYYKSEDGSSLSLIYILIYFLFFLCKQRKKVVL